MKTSRFALVVASLMLAAPFAWSAEGGWTMPNLNPFTAKGTPTKRSNVGEAPISGWHPPALWPKAASGRTAAHGPSTWNKMTNGTQKFFSKTADVLTPWDKNKPAAPQKITGSDSVFTHKSTTEKGKTGSSIAPASWWSSGDKKEQSPKSVNEFLSQPRPH